MNSKPFIVIPTIRNLAFLSDWEKEFAGCTLVIVEDHPTRQINTPKGLYKNVYHYCWEDIKRDFKDKEWIFPRHNAGIRTYGFWKSYQMGAETIVTLDDDCYPTEKGFIQTHVTNLESKAPHKWFPSFPHPDFLYTRGFPYKTRSKSDVVISHGLWSNKLDLDGMSQLRNPNINIKPYPPMRQFVPFGYFFPMSSMNLAFRKEATPLLYFPLMGDDPDGKKWGFDRFDDIWAGVFAKKICDHLGFSIVNGSPFVAHIKASDPNINKQKEATGIIVNEWLWKSVDDVSLHETKFAACYIELATKIKFPNTNYFQKLRKAMMVWGELFNKS